MLGTLFQSSPAKKRIIIALLLLATCLLSLYLLGITPPPPAHKLTSHAQLDSLITDSFRTFNVPDSRLHTQDIRIDSSFTRKRYVVRVDPEFSKTSFHYGLHEKIRPYDLRTIGNVEFPEMNLQIHIAYNQTIHRTIYLYSPSQD